MTFTADGLTIHGTYRHERDAATGPAALLISESGNTDRNGDNAVAGPVGNMRQLAELLSDKGVASLRYDKIGTGKTGLGPYAQRPMDVGQRRLHHRCEGRGELPRRTVRDREVPHLGVRGRRRHHPRDVTGDRHRCRRTKDPLAGPLSAAAGPVPGHHHRPGASQRRPGGAEHLAGRRRPGPHQGHRARRTFPRDSARCSTPATSRR